MPERTPPTVISLFDLDPRKFGSLEEHIVFLSQGLRDRGWRSVLIFSRLPPREIQSRFENAGALVDTCRTDSTIQSYPAVWRALRKYRADVVHFHFFEHFSMLPLLPWLAKARLNVYTDHFRQPQPLSSLTRLNLWLWNRIVPALADVRLVAISQHIKKTLIECYGVDPERVQVILNGANVHRFGNVCDEEILSARRELEIPSSAPIIETVAALIPQKGVSDLLLAAKHVLAHRPDAIFLIVGDGPLASTLQQQAKDLGICSACRFTGLRSDVHRLMALADVVAVPSVWEEPAGLVVIEAMAAGRPVVATRVGGIPEYMQDGTTGILVEPRNPEQLAHALLKLMDSPDLARLMGQAGRERASQRFSMDQWVAETLDFYEHELAEAD